MTTREFGKLPVLLDLVQKLRIRESWVRNALVGLQHSWNPQLYGAVLRHVQRVAEATDPKVIAYMLPEHQLLLQGELVLGNLFGSEDIQLRLPLQSLTRHIFVAGSSGSGKSEFAKSLVEKVLELGVEAIRIVDPKASEYVVLARKYSKFLSVNWSDLRLTIFSPPPKVPWIEWIQSEVSHLSEAFNFWEGTEALLLKHLVKLKQSGIDPTIRDLIHSLRNDRGIFGQKDAMTRSTAISRLEMLDNLFGVTISTDTDMLRTLSSRTHIISTSGLMSTAESWFVEYLLLWEHLYRKYNPSARELTLHVYDECQHRLFSSQKERSQHQTTAPLISKMVDEARSLGLGICSLSQEPSTVIRAIQNNAYARVAFRLGSGSEIRVVRESMGLSDEQANILFYLEPGEAVVRLAGGYMEPMLVKFNKFESLSFCSDGQFVNHQEELKKELYHTAGVKEASAPVEQSSKVSASTSGNPSREQSRAKRSSTTTVSSKNQKPDDGATNAVRSVLSIWLNLPHPFLTQGEIFKRAGIESGSSQSSIKHQLVAQGFVVEYRLQVGKTFAIVLEPTDKAFGLVGISKPSYHSKGGYLHQFVAHRVAEWAKVKGLQPEIEFMLSNGKAVDVMWQIDNSWTFLEIAVSKPLTKELSNYAKDFQGGLIPEKLVVICIDSRDQSELKTLVESDSSLDGVRVRIEFRLAGDFLKL